jgi:TetR/AcrR family transcriptional repressor of lmrAB and yxaGH operons
VRDVVASTASDVGQLIDAVFADAGSAREAVAAMFELCAHAVELHGGDFGCPVTPSVLEAAQDTSILDAGHRAFAHWEERLDTGFRGTGQEPDVAAANATLVVASIEGALVLARAERSAAPVRRVAAALDVLFR